MKRNDEDWLGLVFNLYVWLFVFALICLAIALYHFIPMWLRGMT